MAYPHTWSPISYKSSAGQRKHIGQRPMLYRWTTQPTSMDVAEGGGNERRGQVPQNLEWDANANCPPDFQKIPLRIHPQNTPFQVKNSFFSGEGLSLSPYPSLTGPTLRPQPSLLGELFRSRLDWLKGRRPSGAKSMHSANEPGELSHCLCYDVSTINIDRHCRSRPLLQHNLGIRRQHKRKTLSSC